VAAYVTYDIIIITAATSPGRRIFPPERSSGRSGTRGGALVGVAVAAEKLLVPPELELRGGAAGSSEVSLVVVVMTASDGVW